MTNGTGKSIESVTVRAHKNSLIGDDSVMGGLTL
jgi:hypothetical protein